jgi:hypothetical protein
MKRFGVSNYQLQNVKQNVSNLMLSTKSLLSNRAGQLKDQLKDQFNGSVGLELEDFVTKANQSLVNMNRWLKEREKELTAEIKKEEAETEKPIH